MPQSLLTLGAMPKTSIQISRCVVRETKPSKGHFTNFRDIGTIYLIFIDRGYAYIPFPIGVHILFNQAYSPLC